MAWGPISIGGSASGYTLPTATKDVLGGVKTGTNITNTGGTISLTKDNVTGALGFTPANSTHSHDLSAMINGLSAGTATPADADYYVCQYAGGGSTTTTYHRRPMSALWAYIKAKADTAYAAKSHTHSYAGSGSAGGSATSAVKLDTATAGSATQPVYFTGGKPTACTYTLGKSVPSNAVFTDHTYSAMKGATSSAAGTAGLVPAPAAGAQGKFLRGDGTWQTISSSSKLDAWPVGSIYQTTGSTSPASLFGGTWTEIASERVLMGASSSHTAGSTVNAGLPNISGVFRAYTSGSEPAVAPAFNAVSWAEATSTYWHTGDNNKAVRDYNYSLNASNSSAIYGGSTTVQPAAYYVHIWRRTA